MWRRQSSAKDLGLSPLGGLDLSSSLVRHVMSIPGFWVCLSLVSVTDPTASTCCVISGHLEAPVSAAAGHVRASSLLFHLILMGTPPRAKRAAMCE